MNNGTEALREAVLTDARARAYAITQDAMKAAEKAVASVEEEIAARRADILARADADAARRGGQILAEAESEVRREQLAFRESLIAEVIADARKALGEVAADPARSRPVLLALANEGARAVSGEKVSLAVRAADKALVDAAFLDAVRAATGKWADVAPEPVEALGGLVVTGAGGRERCDNTFDGRLERQTADLRAAIWARMSHA